MDIMDEFKNTFNDFKLAAFRYEHLAEYDVVEEHADFKAYLDGKSLPDSIRPFNEWLTLVRSIVATGRKMTRVRLMPQVMPLYLRFELDWGYLYSSANGEEIRFLTEENLTDNFSSCEMADFWLFDNENLFIMNYGLKGSFLGVRRAKSNEEKEKYIAFAKITLAHSESIRDYLKRYRSGNYRA